MKRNQILRIFGTEYKELTKKLLERADLASHISSKDLRIGIKPNLVVPSPAKFGATTHPEVAAGIIEYLKEHGFNNIVILEGAWIGEKTSDCFEYTGFRAICEEYGLPFLDVQKMGSHKVDCGGMELSISDAINDIGFLINVPVLKGHCQVRMTCALKNIKGLVPNDEKRRFHALGINKPVGHLPAGIPQDFIVVDNICGDLEFEEGGKPVVQNCIMAALDPVLVDSYACSRLGIDVSEVPYIGIAEGLGIGSSDLTNAEISDINENPLDPKTPERSRVLDVAYAVEDLESCSECYANLIPCLIRLKEEGLLHKLDCKIAIGQNHNGRSGKLGIGRCTAGYETCIMGCPPSQDEIYDALRKYILNYSEKNRKTESSVD